MFPKLGSLAKITQVGSNAMYKGDTSPIALERVLSITLVENNKATEVKHCESLPELFKALTQNITEPLYAFEDNNLYVLVNSNNFTDEAEFHLVYERNPYKVTDFEDTLDIDDNDLELFIALCIEQFCLLTGKPVPLQVKQIIDIYHKDMTDGIN